MDKTFCKIIFRTFQYICIIKNHQPYLVISLTAIAETASAKAAENNSFIDFLKSKNSNQIDEIVYQLNEKISASIDCTQCGNCCKTLMINISENEATEVAAYLNQTRTYFDQQNIEKGSNGMMLMNTMPCNFLNNNKCSIYTHRFSGCKEFPALHLPHFSERLFTIFMHYDRCPIVFNVVEQLKTILNFH